MLNQSDRAVNDRGTPRPQGSPIKVDGKGTGCVTHGHTLTRFAHSKTQMLRYPRPAWSFHDVVLAVAKQRGVTEIRVIDRDTGLEYFATMATFLARCQTTERVGWGNQTYLTLDWWQIDGQPAKAAVREEQERAANAQLSLFGGGR